MDVINIIRNRLSIFSFLSLCIISLALSSCGGGSRGAEYQQDEGMVWHTTYHITYRCDRNLRDSILAVIEEVGRSVNVFDTTSLVSRVNRQDTTPVNDDFIRVYVMSTKVNRLSGGAFDPTLGPLIRVWGFGEGHKATSDTARIDSLLQFTGIARTRLDKDRLIKEDRRTTFNFSAIAKGYGCDRVAAMLERNGVKDYLVEIGGEISAAGVSPSGGKWRVSVDRPVLGSAPDSRDSEAIIEISGCGMATSGNYRNFHTDGNRRYGHTISALTGRPVQTDVLSATVIAGTAMEADALATAFMASGSVKAMEISRSMRLPVMLVLADSAVWMSDRFREIVVEN